MPMLNEAFYAVMEGVGTPEAIDAVMKGGMNHPMGPLALADFIGLDVCLAILNVLHEGLGDPKYRAVSAAQADGRCGLSRDGSPAAVSTSTPSPGHVERSAIGPIDRDLGQRTARMLIATAPRIR